MLLLAFYKDLWTGRFSSICLLLILCFFIQYSVLHYYANDNNLFVIGKNKEDIKSLFLLDLTIVNNWFYKNSMILNPGKSHFMCFGKNLDDNEMLNFNNLTIKNSEEVEI